jgi:hypothetical protein
VYWRFPEVERCGERRARLTWPSSADTRRFFAAMREWAEISRDRAKDDQARKQDDKMWKTFDGWCKRI